MYILVNQKRRFLRHARLYLLAAVLTGLFAAVYEVFSHQVYSIFMIGACLIPLLMGSLPAFLIGLLGNHFPGRPTLRLWSWAVAALTAGSLFQGVLEIYGTTNRLILVYPAAAALLASMAFLSLPFYLERRDGTKAVFDVRGDLCGQ